MPSLSLSPYLYKKRCFALTKLELQKKDIVPTLETISLKRPRRFCSWSNNYSAATVLSQAVQVESAAAQQESQHSVFASSVASAFF